MRYADPVFGGNVDVTASDGRGKELPGLLTQLGYRAPHAEELARLDAAPAASAPPDRSAIISAAVLSAEPRISLSGIVGGSPIGLAGAITPGRLDQETWFLLSPTWTVDSDEAASAIRTGAIRHRRANPLHRFIVLANAAEEVDRLRQHGEAAFLFNKTAFANENVFRPLWRSRRAFDAIYNAQLVGWKRHELSLDIARCAFLFYRAAVSDTEAGDEQAILARHATEAPGHVFLNRIDSSGLPVRLPPRAVNRHLNSAAVGLCLSREEGAMFASTEYLLAGLPVVTTPSRGGRDAYFDEEFCWAVAPDRRSVGEAVAALAARKFPPSHVRARTLQKIDRARARFVDLLDAIIEESGQPPRFAGSWPFRKKVTMEWQPFEGAAERLTAGQVDGFERAGAGRLLGRTRDRLLRLIEGR